MINNGLRRWFFRDEVCDQCGEPRHRRYLLHPFPLPKTKGHWLFSDCACIRKERDRERSARQQLLAVQPRHPLPPGLHSHSFNNFKVGEFNRETYGLCRTFARNFSKVEKGQGLLIFGRSGTGKTHLAAAIVNELKDKYRVEFAYLPGLLDKMRTTNVALEPLITADLLVLDDVGGERETGWTMERLLIIVDGRLTNLKPTVFTTNYDPDDLEKKVGMRVSSRILGHNLQLFLQGPDWRLIPKK